MTVAEKPKGCYLAHDAPKIKTKTGHAMRTSII